MPERIIKAGERIIKRLDPSFLEIKSIDEKTRTIWHPITREVKDRMGDIVRVDGGQFDEFKKKPAVLYGHDYRSMNPIPVIGENIGFEKDGDRLYAGTRFLPVATPDMSQALKDLINDNWILQAKKLLGWSIGFMAVDWAAMMEGDDFQGYDFKTWKLLEYSSVIIPAHQDAVNDALKGGTISGAVLKYFDLGANQNIKFSRHDEKFEAVAATKTEDDPNKREATPETIKEPAVEPEAQMPNSTALKAVKATETKQGETMLEKIIEKLSKGEELTPEEKEFWTKYQSAMAQKAAAAPVRKLDLVDSSGKVEARSVKRFYSASPDDETSKQVADDPRSYSDAEKELCGFLDDSYIVASILRKNPRSLKMWDSFLGHSSALRKALDTATAAEGTEWVPTLLSADFITRFRLEAKVAALFPDLPMPSNPWKMPYFGGMTAGSFYLVPESISDEASASPPTTPATAAQTLTAVRFRSRTYFSDELSEDSIVPVLPILRSEMVTAGAEVIEDVVLNGDVTATHQDSDVVDSKDRRKGWSGLRKLCPSGTKGSLATFTAASHILAFKTLMGKYGLNPKELAIITGPVGMNKFLALTETITVDKYGPNATILTGELAKIFGIPIIASEYIRENLNATGVYDGSLTTKTEVIIVNQRGFMLGTRGGVKLTFKTEAEVDQNQLIMSFRKAFQPRWTPSSTVTTIAVGYNI